MTPDETVSKYRLVIKFAAAKATRKWGSYMRAFPQSCRPFDTEDIDQWALEGLLVLAGHMDGPKSVYGKLDEFDAEGGEKYVQHSLDWYVSNKCSTVRDQRNTTKRGSGERVDYLTQTDAYGEEFRIDEDPQAGLETGSDLTPGGAWAQYPCLYATQILGLKRDEALKWTGLSLKKYWQAREDEIRRLAEWGESRRLLAA